MAKSPAATLATQSTDLHLELSRAHQEAARLSHQLAEDLAQMLRLDLKKTQAEVLEVGNALHRVGKAERECGACTGQNHNFSNSYREMLEQHRLAYIDYDHLARELESAASAQLKECARLAADIEHHVRKAETSHQATIWSTGPRKA